LGEGTGRIREKIKNIEIFVCYKNVKLILLRYLSNTSLDYFFDSVISPNFTSRLAGFSLDLGSLPFMYTVDFGIVVIRLGFNRQLRLREFTDEN
jgi:hypothetical protein